MHSFDISYIIALVWPPKKLRNRLVARCRKRLCTTVLRRHMAHRPSMSFMSVLYNLAKWLFLYAVYFSSLFFSFFSHFLIFFFWPTGSFSVFFSFFFFFFFSPLVYVFFCFFI